jgi:hypothetical protein
MSSYNRNQPTKIKHPRRNGEPAAPIPLHAVFMTFTITQPLVLLLLLLLLQLARV